MTTNRKHRFLALFFLPVFVFAFSFFFDPVISKAASASTDGTFYAALADISGSMPEDASVSAAVPSVMLVYCLFRQSYVYWVIRIDTESPSRLLMTRTASPRKMFWRKA